MIWLGMSIWPGFSNIPNYTNDWFRDPGKPRFGPVRISIPCPLLWSKSFFQNDVFSASIKLPFQRSAPHRVRSPSPIIDSRPISVASTPKRKLQDLENDEDSDIIVSKPQFLNPADLSGSYTPIRTDSPAIPAAPIQTTNATTINTTTGTVVVKRPRKSPSFFFPFSC
jgi:hypothetical protein